MGKHCKRFSVMTPSSRKKLTLPLICLMTFIILIIAGFFLYNKLLSTPIEIKNIEIDTKSTFKLNALKQISKKNGIREWELSAATATLLKKEEKAVLKDVRILFYTEDQKTVLLTAENGELNTKTHDMTFSGDVLVRQDTFNLRTQKLHYTKKEHIIHTDQSVRLEKENSVIDADSMKILLNDNSTVLSGHVRGIFSANFNIK